MKPRNWIVAIAACLPEPLWWLAVWIINLEADRVEREMRKLGAIIEALARGAWRVHLQRERWSALAAAQASANAEYYRQIVQAPDGVMRHYSSPLSGYMNSLSGQSSLNSMIGNLLGNTWTG